ncbi:MAG: NapC/NirT family cytochrome c [Chloroflexi bacterium]|nr:NapC/NirT family cytochrome c [Chloroflexota bacterium]
MKRLAWAAALVAALAVLAAGGVFGALQLEERNEFCASCHTEPETAYLARTMQSAPSDLASAHVTARTARCIDCHSGAGTAGRVAGLRQGALDLAAYLSGAYHRPAVTTGPLADANCVRCHDRIFESRNLRNHYHFYLLNWQAKEPGHAARCVDCHTSHTQGPSRTLKYAVDAKLNPVCAACHTFSGIRS